MSRIACNLLVFLALAWAGGAGAVPYTGTLVMALGDLPPVSLVGSGSGDPTLPSISINTFVGSATAPVTGVPPLTQILLTIAGNGAGAVGSGPVFTGSALALGSGLGIPIIGVPIGGLGLASSQLPRLHSGGSGSVSAHFGAWRTGLASIARTTRIGRTRSHTGLSVSNTNLFTTPCTPAGNTCPTAMLGGATANAQYFSGAAQIVLVAPIDLYTTTGAIGGLPSFTILALNYVPEPGTLLLLGSGVTGLALAGRRRL